LPFYGSRKLPFSSCALVGSSPSLKKKSLGKQIDSHALVMRFNNAPTRGYQKWVGGKTTMRFTNNRYHGHRERAREAVVGAMCSPYPKPGEVRCQGKKSKVLGLMNKKKMFALNPSFDRYIIAPFRKKKAVPSSGFKMLVMLVHVCKKVDVYGMMGTKSFRTWYWGKYAGYKGKPNPDVLAKLWPKLLFKSWTVKSWPYAGKTSPGPFYKLKKVPASAGRSKGKGGSSGTKPGKDNSDHNMGFEKGCLGRMKSQGMVTLKT